MSVNADTEVGSDRDLNGSPCAPARPLRADAERNRRRILDAARELFATRGLDITLDDVADHAGVGIGTVYRRFTNKLELIDGVFEQRMADLLEVSDRCGKAEDPWTGLVEFMEFICDGMSLNRGLGEVVLGTSDVGCLGISALREKLDLSSRNIIFRARESGQLRSDIEVNDFFPLMTMISTATEFTSESDPANWRRYFAIVLDGLRSQPHDATPLPGRPLTNMEVATAKAKLHNRRH